MLGRVVGKFAHGLQGPPKSGKIQVPESGFLKFQAVENCLGRKVLVKGIYKFSETEYRWS